MDALKTNLIGLFMDTKQSQLFVVLKHVFLLHFLKENKRDTQKKEKKTHSAAVTKFQLYKKIIQILSEF